MLTAVYWELFNSHETYYVQDLNLNFSDSSSDKLMMFRRLWNFELLVLLKLNLCLCLCSFGPLTKQVVLRALRLFPWLLFENGIQVNFMHSLLASPLVSSSSYYSAPVSSRETLFYCTLRNTKVRSTMQCAHRLDTQALWYLFGQTIMTVTVSFIKLPAVPAILPYS